MASRFKVFICFDVARSLPIIQFAETAYYLQFSRKVRLSTEFEFCTNWYKLTTDLPEAILKHANHHGKGNKICL